MRTNSLIIFISLLSALSCAHAQTAAPGPLPNLPGKEPTPFNILLSDFSKGTALNYQTYRGFYAGRCYLITKQRKARGSLTGYWEDNAVPPETGTDFRVIAYDYPNKGVDYYDNEDHVQADRQQLRDAVPSRDRLRIVSSAPTLTWQIWNRTEPTFAEQHELVAYRGKLIGRWTVLVDGVYNEVGFRHAGETVGMCSYFKKVAD